MATMATRKVRKLRNIVRLKEKAKNAGANVRFTEIEGNSARNTAISTDQAETVSGENGVNFAAREVLTPSKDKFTPT